MKYAILSTTLDEEYSFYAPLTARMWVEVGYKPFIVFHGKPEEWSLPRHRVLFEYLKHSMADYLFLGNVKGCSKALAIKLARWYAGCYTIFADDDYLLTSDIDLWPLSFAWYSSQDPEKRYHLFNADIHGGAMHSTCHIGAQAKYWRKLMGVSSGDDIAKVIEKSVAGAFAKHDSSWIGKRSDEQFMKTHILDFGGYPADFQFIDRGSPPEGRIDRDSWPEKVETGGKIDAHLLRPGTDPRVWELVSPLIPDTLRAWADEYQFEYMESR